MKTKSREAKSSVLVKEVEKTLTKNIIRQALLTQIMNNFPNDNSLCGFMSTMPNYILEHCLLEHFGKSISFVRAGTGDNYNRAKDYSVLHKKNFGIRTELYKKDDLDYFKNNKKDKFDFVLLEYFNKSLKYSLQVLEEVFKNNSFSFKDGVLPLIGLTVPTQDPSIKYSELVLISSAKQPNRESFQVRMGGIPKIVQELAMKYGMSITPQINFECLSPYVEKKKTPILIFIFNVQMGVIDNPMWDTSLKKIHELMIAGEL